MSWLIIFILAWFGAIAVILLFIRGAAILRDAENTRRRCIKRIPDRRLINHNYRSIEK